MYTLFINTIQNASLAVFNNNNLLLSVPFSNTGKAGDVALLYLQDLQNQLLNYNLTINNINNIAVCVGPSYFTASRIGVVIANTIASYLQINSIIAINSVGLLHYYAKNLITNYAQYTYTIIAINIGKTGAIIAVFSNNATIIQPTYLQENQIPTTLHSVLQNKCLVLGCKTDLFTKYSNCDIITHNAFNNYSLLANYISSNNNLLQNVPVVPSYIKEADINN